MAHNKPSEEFCKGCPDFIYWFGEGGMAHVPACDHRSLSRIKLIPAELKRCPRER